MKTLFIDGLFVYKNLAKSYNGKSSLEIIYERAKKNRQSCIYSFCKCLSRIHGPALRCL